MSSSHSQLRLDIKLSMITLYKTSKRRTIHDSGNKQPSSISGNKRINLVVDTVAGKAIVLLMVIVWTVSVFIVVLTQGF